MLCRFSNPVANQKKLKYLLGEELIRSQQRSIKNKDEAAYLKRLLCVLNRWF
jgi:hypothetical protein